MWRFCGKISGRLGRRIELEDVEGLRVT